MPLLDNEQHAQVAKIIREGLHRAHDLQTGQLTQVQSELATATAQIRSTTKEFVVRQNSHLEQFEARIAKFATHTESQISKLCQELGDELQKGDAKIAEFDLKIVEFASSFESKKIAINLAITASFAEFGEKCTEMRQLIGESHAFLQREQALRQHRPPHHERDD